MIESLTPEQTAKFPYYVEKWTNIGRDTTPADRPRAEAAVRLIYEKANLKKPEIVWCESPMAMIKQYGPIDNCIWGAHEAGWLSFYDFFREEFGHTDPVFRLPQLDGLIELSKSAGWTMPYEGICYVSERHNILRFDDEGLLHCEDGPSVGYPDGYAIYSWHGQTIPSEWITDREKLKAQTALTWPNIEQRRAACEILGWEEILRELKAVVIDEDPDPQIGTLVEVDIPDIGKEKFLRVLCATGRRFALPVPPTMMTALDAQADTWGLTRETFVRPEIRT